MALPASLSRKDRVHEEFPLEEGKVAADGKELPSAIEAIGAAAAAGPAPILPDVVPVKIDRRGIKIAVSQNCLAALKHYIAPLSLRESSVSLAAMPKAKEEKAAYDQKMVDLRRDERFSPDYVNLGTKVDYLQQIIKNPRLISERNIQRITDNPAILAEVKKCKDDNSRRKIIQMLTCELMGHPVYVALKMHEHDPLVHVLHMASEIFHHHSEGMSVFETYGHGLLGPLDKAEYSAAEVEAHLRVAVSASSNSSVDNLAARLFTHAPFHWERAGATHQSNKAGSDETYNPYETGNYNASLGDYQFGDVSIGSSAGPNPSHRDYRIFPATGQFNSNLVRLLDGRGPSHLQAVLEGAEDHQGPKDRRASVIAMERDDPNLSIMALPLDGDAWDGTGAFHGVRTTRDFITQIAVKLGGDRLVEDPDDASGFRIPATVDREAVSRAIMRFKNAFQTLEGTAAWTELEKSGKLCKTLLLGFNSCLILEGMRVQAGRSEQVVVDGLTIKPTCNMACKQGIDRGAVQNQMVRLLVDANQQGDFQFSRTKVRQYCGYTAGRATSVEARRIQKKRFETVPNFLSLVAAARPQERRAFLAALELPENLRFVPSNGRA